MYPRNSEKFFNVDDVSEASNIGDGVSGDISEHPHTSCSVKRPFIDIKCESLTEVPSFKRMDLKQDPDSPGVIGLQTDHIPLVVTNPKPEIKSECFTEEISTSPAINNTEQMDAVPSSPKKALKSGKCQRQSSLWCIKNSANTGKQLLKSEGLVSRPNYTWNPSFVTSLNIYKIAISMICLDKEEFECYFSDKIKLISPTVAEFGNESKIKLDLSTIYVRVKNYILETFIPFLKKSENETKAKIELYHGMSLDNFGFAYISNEKFFTKLRSFCNEVITCVKNIDGSVLIDMIPYSINLEVEGVLPKIVKKIYLGNHKCKFNKYTLELLVGNISSIPKRIVAAIRSLRWHTLIGEHFSSFYNLYVDNKSLLKARLVFDATKQKIINDKLLIELVNVISSDMVDKFGRDFPKNVRKFINDYIVCGNLSTQNYIKKLVIDEFHTLRENLADPIMIVRHDKVEIADKKIRCEILNKLESDLIMISTSLYRKLCVNQFRLKNKE